jgi:hypothetical protein
MVAPFVAVFLIWLVVLRPEQWPASLAEWLTLPAWGAALTQLLSQVLLVSVLLAVGRGIGAVADFVPLVNPVFPLAVSFLAIPLCRLLWDAREAADQGIFLDEEAEAAHYPRAAAEAAAAIVPLLNLPDSAPDSEAIPAVDRVLALPGPDLRLKALAAALSQPSRSHAALRRALALWLSEPERVAPGQVPGAMTLAFGFAQSNADLLRLYVPRALALILAFPDRAGDFPTPERLREAAAAEPGSDPGSDLPVHLRADLRDGLHALAHAIERAAAGEAPPAEPRREALPQKKARVA